MGRFTRRLRYQSALICASSWLLPGLWTKEARAVPIEVSVQAVLSIVNDFETKGGGAGPALEVGLPLAEDLLLDESTLLVRLRLSTLFGAGVAWFTEVGVVYRAPVLPGWPSYRPELGLYGLYAGGDLIRTIDAQGRLAGNPVALELGLNAIRFERAACWLSTLGGRAGPTLFREGAPALALSISLLEVGRRF